MAAGADEGRGAVAAEVRRIPPVPARAHPVAGEAPLSPRPILVEAGRPRLRLVVAARAGAEPAQIQQPPVAGSWLGKPTDRLREANAQVHPGPPAHGSMATRSLG